MKNISLPAQNRHQKILVLLRPSPLANPGAKSPETTTNSKRETLDTRTKNRICDLGENSRSLRTVTEAPTKPISNRTTPGVRVRPMPAARNGVPP